VNIEDPTLDQHKFQPVMPQLQAILAPLCPYGFKVLLVVIEATHPVTDVPRSMPAAVHMITDIKDSMMLLDLLTSCSARLSASVPIH
jgi:hypothetical protein